MTFKDETLRTALMGAMATVIKDANEAQRKKILADLLDIYKDTGNKSWTITLPSGDKVATITLNESSPEAVATNPDALLQWCKANRADLVETLIHPRVDEWTEERLSPHAVATIAKDYKLVDTSPAISLLIPHAPLLDTWRGLMRRLTGMPLALIRGL